jgi:hypothetical protein
MEIRTFELEFAKFIQRFHEQIKEAFVEDACDKRELLGTCPGGRKILDDMADDVLKEFTANVDRKTSVEVIAERYIDLGKRCCLDDVRYSDMVRVLTLLKRHVWLFFQDNNFAGQPFDVRSIVALNNRTALFFDRAIYYLLTGYEEASTQTRSEMESLYTAFLNKVRRDLAASNDPSTNDCAGKGS